MTIQLMSIRVSTDLMTIIIPAMRSKNMFISTE